MEKFKIIALESACEPDPLLFECEAENFSECLRKAREAGVNLSYSDLCHRDFGDIDISPMDLEGADITLSNLSEVDLWDANISFAKADGAVFDGWLTNTNFTFSSLRGAVFKRFSEIRECDFTGADLTEVDFSGTEIRSCIFKNCSLNKASFQGAEIKDCNFEGAKIRQADCTDVEFGRSSFKDADLEETIFDGSFITQVEKDQIPKDCFTYLLKNSKIG